MGPLLLKRAVDIDTGDQIMSKMTGAILPGNSTVELKEFDIGGGDMVVIGIAQLPLTD